jgi:hypothetical protein
VKLYVAVCLGAVVFIVKLYYHVFLSNANIGVIGVSEFMGNIAPCAPYSSISLPKILLSSQDIV